MSRLSEADVQKSCKPKDAATEGFCFQQTMIRVKVGLFNLESCAQMVRQGPCPSPVRCGHKCPCSPIFGLQLHFSGYCKIIGILHWCAWNATDC